jgi:hypothetical protein
VRVGRAERRSSCLGAINGRNYGKAVKTIMFRVSAVVGYENHDDYIQTGKPVLLIDDEEINSFAGAEVAARDQLLGGGDDLDSYNHWCRIEKIERVYTSA